MNNFILRPIIAAARGTPDEGHDAPAERAPRHGSIPLVVVTDVPIGHRRHLPLEADDVCVDRGVACGVDYPVAPHQLDQVL